MDVPYFTLSGIKTRGRLIDVYDGDTVTCIFPILGENYFKFNIRLAGIDTAELKNKDVYEKMRAYKARHTILETCCDNYDLSENCSRDDIKRYLSENEIFVKIECFDFDKYGRVLANIYKADKDNDICISDVLLENKLAYKYDGGTKIKN